MTDRPGAAISKRREDRRARASRRLHEALHRGSGQGLGRAIEFCTKGRFSNAREVMSPEQLVASLLANGVRVVSATYDAGCKCLLCTAPAALAAFLKFDPFSAS